MTGRIEVSFASFEAPEHATGRIEVSWASFETPDAPVGQPDTGGTGAGQPVGGTSSPSPFRDAIREANRPRKPVKRAKRKLDEVETGPVSGLLAQIAAEVTPAQIEAEIQRALIIGDILDELEARASLARRILQDEQDAVIALILAS